MELFHPCLVFLLLLTVGCTGPSRATPTTLPADTFRLESRADLGVDIHVPIGWTIDRYETRENAVTQTWVGPSRHVALGVIHFPLPFPVGHELSLAGFLQRFAKEDGAVTLTSKTWDDTRQAIRFTAHGKKRQMEALLIVRGRQGWAIFAGTLLNTPAPRNELTQAQSARDAAVTHVR